jgi:hypothetical protein
MTGAALVGGEGELAATDGASKNQPERSRAWRRLVLRLPPDTQRSALERERLGLPASTA